MALPTVAMLENPVKLGLELGKVDDIDVVWAGPSVDAMIDVLPTLQPRVLVLQLEHLGRTPMTRAQLLMMLAGAELTIVTYKFARQLVLDALRDESIRTLEEPLTAPQLLTEITEALGASASSEDTPKADVIRLSQYAVDSSTKIDLGPLSAVE